MEASMVPASWQAGGYAKFGKGRYDWKVLDIKNGKALLVSHEVLTDKAVYHSMSEDVTWENCDLRERLNGEWYEDFFTEDEKKQIIGKRIKNRVNPWYGTEGGKGTPDKLFLLSIQEVVRYFGDSGQLLSRLYDTVIRDQYDAERIAKMEADPLAPDRERYMPMKWWLRSPGEDNCRAAVVAEDGSIDLEGYDVDDQHGLRPALWIHVGQSFFDQTQDWEWTYDRENDEKRDGWTHYHSGEQHAWGVCRDAVWEYCIGGEWIYYCNLNDQKEIFRMREDGSGKQEWLPPLPEHFTVSESNSLYYDEPVCFLSDGWVFFLNIRQNPYYAEIYKMRPDGSGCERIFRNFIGDDYEVVYEILQVTGGWVHYNMEHEYYDFEEEHRIRTDGTDGSDGNRIG